MTAVQEREVTYVEKDAKPPLVISDSPADHVPFNKKDEYWRYLPSKSFDKLAIASPAAGKPSLSVTNASLVHKVTKGAVSGLRVREVVTAIAVASDHNQYIVTIDKTASGKLVEIELATDFDSNSSIQIDVSPEVETQVLLRDKGRGDTALSVAINIQKAAQVKFVLLTDQSASGIHYGHVSANVGRDASLTLGVISLGGQIVRRSIDSLFSDSSAEMVLLGATHSASGQYCEHRTVVDHNMTNCRSYVDFRSAVDGVGTHSVWVGDTIIRYNATGSDTYETNRNLVLSKGARADSVPNLEIETGEVVGAGHASATGRLDDEHLFYLTSRGLTSAEALKLIVVGFFANIVERMGIPAIVDEVVQIIETKLLTQGDK